MLEKDSEGIHIAGAGSKYAKLIELAARLMKGTPLIDEGFTYSNLGIASGKIGLEVSNSEIVTGARALCL